MLESVSNAWPPWTELAAGGKDRETIRATINDERAAMQRLIRDEQQDGT
ncbi:MAG: hypothetical protein WD066_03650 [Planctomycetaceae bacterium]